MKLRLFIALPLTNAVESKLGDIIADLSKQTRDVKWVASKNIHLTVKFLGDTDEALVPSIIAATDQIAGKYQSMSSTIDSIGAFPNLNRPRVIWAGGHRPLDTAARIAGDVDIAMHKLRFEREKRPFKPHLTLGRVRQGRRVEGLASLFESYRFDPIPLRLDRLVLFKSTLTPQGAIYDRLHESMLGSERFEG